MSTALLICIVICITLITMDLINKISSVIDRKHYYDMVAQYPEAFEMTEEAFKKWQATL